MQIPKIRLLLGVLIFASFLAGCTPEMMPTPLAAAATATATAASLPTLEAAQTQPPVITSAPAVKPTLAVTAQKTLTAQPINPAVPGNIVQETPVMNDVPVPTPFDAQMQALANQAKADLAQKLSIQPDQVELVGISFVSWPDSSLGCPKPGMAYAQVMVDGLRIRLKAGGKSYEYHSGGSRAPFLCQ
jgi:hypothetical protein